MLNFCKRYILMWSFTSISLLRQLGFHQRPWTFDKQNNNQHKVTKLNRNDQNKKSPLSIKHVQKHEAQRNESQKHFHKPNEPDHKRRFPACPNKMYKNIDPLGIFLYVQCWRTNNKGLFCVLVSLETNKGGPREDLGRSIWFYLSSNGLNHPCSRWCYVIQPTGKHSSGKGSISVGQFVCFLTYCEKVKTAWLIS